MPDREVVRNAVARVLFNASNYPLAAQSRMLGQDTRPLTDKVTDAVMFALIAEADVENGRQQ